MKIFLSGKMDGDGDWRDALLGPGTLAPDLSRLVPRWEMVRPLPGEAGYLDAPVPILPFPRAANTLVLGTHDYVGPYRQVFRPPQDRESIGEQHGVEAYGQHGYVEDAAARAAIVRECRAAIERADYVFAVINTRDAYGSIAEVVYAHALGKYVHLVLVEPYFPPPARDAPLDLFATRDPRPDWDTTDLWFVEGFATDVDRVAATADTAAWRRAYQAYDDNAQRVGVERLLLDGLLRYTALPTRSGVDLPPTAKQMDFLRNLGYTEARDGPVPDRRRAGELIAAFKAPSRRASASTRAD